MTMTAMVTGSIFREIEMKTSSKQRPYLTGSLKIVDGSEVCFVRFVVLGEETRRELEGLHDGDKVSLVGRIEVSAYMPSGATEPRASLKIIVDRAIALRSAARKAPARAKPAQRQTTRTGTLRTKLPPDDGSIPWVP